VVSYGLSSDPTIRQPVPSASLARSRTGRITWRWKQSRETNNWSLTAQQSVRGKHGSFHTPATSHYN